MRLYVVYRESSDHTQYAAAVCTTEEIAFRFVEANSGPNVSMHVEGVSADTFYGPESQP